jgi:uncharacterized protein with GYD domain
MVLYSFTDQAIKSPAQIPAGVEQTHATIAQMGGTVLACYVLMGEYDAVGIYELPSDEIAMTFLLGMGASGAVRTKTFRAFPPEALAELVKQLPT